MNKNKGKIFRTRTKIEAVATVSILILVCMSAVIGNRIITDTGDTVSSTTYTNNLDTYIRNSNGKYWSATWANVQLAIDDVESTGGGGWVKLPVVNFTASSPIYINQSISLIGSGSARRMESEPPANPGTRITSTSLLNNYVIYMGKSTGIIQGMQIRDLSIYEAYPYKAKGAIKLLNGFGCKIENVFISGFRNLSYKGTGINITSAGTYGCYYNVLDNVHIFNCRKGLVIWGQSGTSYCNANTFLTGSVGADTGTTFSSTGILIHGSDTNYVGGVDVYSFRYGDENSNGIRLESTECQYNKFMGTRFEGNSVSINITDGSTGRNIFIGNSFYTASAYLDRYVNDSGTYISTFTDNDKYLQENCSTATINSGTLSVTVTHGLGEIDYGLIPDVVLITEYTNHTGNAVHFWVSDVTSTTFKINADAALTSAASFYWIAKMSKTKLN